MIIKFAKNLSRQEIYANGVELAAVMGIDKDEKGKRVYVWPDDKTLYVAAIQNPILATDIYKISKFNPILRDTLFKLFESPVRITEYDGVSINFEQDKYRGVWGPSIDTLLFCRALGKINLVGAKNIIEIGAGSGFITKYLLHKISSIKKATLVDLNPYAIQCCKDNIGDRRAEFIAGDGVACLEGKKYDLIICNPPYVPRQKSIDDNPYEGTGLLKYLIKNLDKYLNENGKFITNISSLSGKEIYGIIRSVKISAKKIDAMAVPLKVCNVLNNKKWMGYLAKHGLKKRRKNGYDYWQTITITELEMKP